MKKTTPIFAFSLISLLLTSCSSGSSNKGTSNANLYYAYQHESLLQGYDYLEKEPSYYGQRDYSLSFDGLKGEYDAMQLIINAKKDINSFEVTIDKDLEDGKGNVIKASQFELYAAWYVHISISNEMSKLGDYPDALIPLNKYIAKGKNFISKGKNQSIYFNLFIPENAVAGDYTSTATLTLDGEKASIPLSVKVRKQTMSSAVHKESCFLIWYDQIVYGEKENNTPSMRKSYYDFVASKRIMPGELPPEYTSSPELFAESVYQLIANNEKISATRFPVSGANFSEQRVRNYLSALVTKTKSLRNIGDKTTDLFKKLNFYVDDEPDLSRYDTVKAHDKLLYDLKCEYAAKLDKDDVSIESCIKMKNIVTTQFKEALVATETTGGVQTWCPLFTWFDTKISRELYKSRMNSKDRLCGENVWWYGCMNPTLPYASYHTDAPLTGAKVISMMQYAYEIQGEIYWNVNYYQQYEGGVSHSRDIWNDNVTWEGCNGDGFLVYPAYDYGTSTPISTLRLENILAGNEQYEYLYMLNEYVEKYNKEHSTNENLNQLLETTYAKLFDDCCPTYDAKNSEYTKIFDDVNKQLLDSLDAFNSSLEEGMNYLKGLK